MIQEIINKKYIFSSLLILGGLIFGNSVLAQIICPARTTVEGQNVIFVGELTDTGGEATLVWFDYGQTIGYGLKTPERTLTQIGRYCITVSDLLPCTTYHYRAAARNPAGTSHGENRTFTTRCAAVSVDLKANNSDGPITIPHNHSVTLSWTTRDTISCHASGGWSGAKSTSGSQSTGNLISSQTFTLSCTGPGGTSSDHVIVNVVAPAPAILTVDKLVRNLSDGTGWLNLVPADPNEIVSFSIQVAAGGQSEAKNIIVKDTLPAQIIYQGNLRIDNIPWRGDIISGLNIGDLRPGQSKTITFEAHVAPEGHFRYGETTLANTVTAYNPGTTSTDTARIVVTKRAVAGAVTEVKTGIANNRVLDYFLLPLLISLLLIFLFKNHFVLLSERLEQWLEKNKKEMIEFRSKRILGKKIARIKIHERFIKQ